MNCSEKKDKIAVSVICIAFNHEKYIAQCLDNMISQKTNFKFDIIVHDDASTDGTTDIIKEYVKKYPDIIKPIYQKENQYSQGNDVLKIAAQEAKGKYLAFCEGDDYWCDNNKLQLQYDFMESHKDVSICFHNTATYNVASEVMDKEWFFWKDRPYNGSGYYTSEELIQLNVVPFSSQFYKNEYYNRLCKSSFISIYGDLYITLYMAINGKGYCMDKTMSVYRRNVEASTMTRKNKSIEKYNNELLSLKETFIHINNMSDKKYNDLLDEQIKKLNESLISINFDTIQAMYKKYDRIYIYGIGVYGEICLSELIRRNVEVNGYVISNPNHEEKDYNGYPVLGVDEVLNDETTLLIISAGKKARLEIIENFNKNNFKNYCIGIEEKI